MWNLSVLIKLGYRQRSNNTSEMEDIKVKLSMLWIFVMFNMVFADIIGFLNPGTLEETLAMKPAPGLLLIFSI